MRPPVRLGEEPDELIPGAGGVGAKQQVPTVETGQEVVGVPPDQWQVEVESGQQLRGHQPKQIGTCGGAQPGCPRKGPLRPASAADYSRLLHDLNRQSGPRKQGGSDETVVTGADHDDVAHPATSHATCCSHQPDGKPLACKVSTPPALD